MEATISKMEYYAQMARETGLSIGGIRRRIRLHGDPLKPTTGKRGPKHHAGGEARKCLYCGQMFSSSEIGNRRCPTCTEKTANISPKNDRWLTAHVFGANFSGKY